MYIKINGTNYSAVKSLTFSPEVDLTGQSIPVNEFTADIISSGINVSHGSVASLYDDLDNLWAYYRVTLAERIDLNTVRIRAKSHVSKLDQYKLSPVMYQGDSLASVLQGIFAQVGSAIYEVDQSLLSNTVTGYCPEQTARERLLWVCLSIGACVIHSFCENIRIVPIYDDDEDPVFIPDSEVFWKPTVTFDDWVTSIKIKYYAFTRNDDPGTKDKWVEAGGYTYTYTEQEYTLTNDDAPSTAPAKDITFDGNMLINANNVGLIAIRLVKQYFKRPVSADVDIIDNAAHVPGDWVMVRTDEQTIRQGCIASAAYSFGVQARARLKLSNVADVEGATLTVRYFDGNIKIGQRKHLLPVGYTYTVQNPYIDWTMDGHRVIYRPETDTITGVLDGDYTEDVPCYPALDLTLRTGLLKVISVDGANIDNEGTVTIT